MAAEQRTGEFQFAIDRGGTFTDVWARCPDGRTKVLKLLSEDPANYQDAPREGIRRILQQVSSLPMITGTGGCWLFEVSEANNEYTKVPDFTVKH